MRTQEIKIVREITKSLEKQKAFKGYGISVKAIKDYDDLFSHKLIVIFVIKTGISFSLFESISGLTPFTNNQWANFLQISMKSFQRYKQEDKYFKPLLSEKIMELAEVTHKGIDVFGSKEKFELWLNAPSYALGNLAPIELLNDSYGKELVIAELTRIDHGILG